MISVARSFGFVFLAVFEKTILRRLVEPLGRFPQFLCCDTPLSFLDYILSFVQISSGLGTYRRKTLPRPVEVNALQAYNKNPAYAK